MKLLGEVGRKVRAYVLEVIAEDHRAPIGWYDEDGERWIERGGRYANSQREALGYTGANVAALRALLKRCGQHVTPDQAENVLAATLYRARSADRFIVGAPVADRVASFRAKLPAGACVTCGKPARDDRRTCQACHDSALARQRNARAKRKLAANC